MSGTTNKGLFFALLAAAISGIAIFYNKVVVVSGIDPLVFNILKNGGTAVALTFLLIASGESKNLKKTTLNSWFKFALIAIAGGSIPFVLFFDALRFEPAVNAAIIQKTLFIWVALLAIPFLGERLSYRQVLGYILIAVSNLVIGGFTGFTGSHAEFMILTATILWSLENVIAKKALKVSGSLTVSWARMFFGSLILLLFALFQNKARLIFSIHPGQLPALLGSILILTGYVACWYKALKLAPATLVTSVLILATPITNILSVLFITHSLQTPQVISLAGTFIGLVLVVKMFRKSVPADTTALG